MSAYRHTFYTAVTELNRAGIPAALFPWVRFWFQVAAALEGRTHRPVPRRFDLGAGPVR